MKIDRAFVAEKALDYINELIEAKVATDIGRIYELGNIEGIIGFVDYLADEIEEIEEHKYEFAPAPNIFDELGLEDPSKRRKQE